MSQYIGSPFQAYGALMQGKQTSDLLDNQAATQRRNATEALVAAKFNADRSSMIAGKKMGEITSEYAASGVDMNSGSVMAVLAGSAANAELDRQNIIHGGELRAVNYQNQASLDELGAKHALQAGYFNALSNIVAGTGNYMSQHLPSGTDSTDSEDPYKTDYSAADSLGQGQEAITAGGDEDLAAAVV